MKKLLFLLFLLCGGVVGGLYYLNHHDGANPGPTLITERLSVGEVTEKVSATGRITPREGGVTVVSMKLPVGQIVELAEHAEVGQSVAKGQLLFRLEDVIAQAQVEEAKAGVVTAEAAVRQAKAKLLSAEAGKRLGESTRDATKVALDNAEKKYAVEGVIAKGIVDDARSKYQAVLEGVNQADALVKEAEAGILTAEANLKRAHASLKLAEQNLAFHQIRAPIDGVILDRSKFLVPGAVVSPQQSPLFTIATNLTDCWELVAQVGEADISKIRVGMPVTFTVEAYADRRTKFTGKVTRIAVVPSVPNRTGAEAQIAGLTGLAFYAVNIEIDKERGPDGKPVEKHPLKAGLNANVDLIVETRTQVLRVSNSALSYTPDKLSDAVVQELEAKRALGLDPVWVKTPTGGQEPRFVRRLLTDGTYTAIEPETGSDLHPDSEVIVEATHPPENPGWLKFDKPLKIGL